MIWFDATEVAEKAGTVKSMNIVMIGAAYATGKLPISEDALLQAIKNRVPPKYQDQNLEAFRLGRQAGKRFLSEPV